MPGGVPLFLVGPGENPAVIQAVAAFWSQSGNRPRWADLETNMTDQFYGSGIQAISALIAPRQPTQQGITFPRISPSDDYYSSSLILLSSLAYRERASTIS